MDSTFKLLISFSLLFLIISLGTVGYMMLEGWDLLDALYMTVITIATVGYSEVHQVSRAGRLFTIILILVGVGFLGYVAGSIVQFMVEGRIRIILGKKRLDRKIERIKQHYIICGYGRIGRVLSRNLIYRQPFEMVIIEQDPELVPAMERDGVLYVLGDATDEAILLKAGILRAKALIALLATDADNVFLVLTARQLAPKLNITARASGSGSRAKLMAAGANTVESPYDMGAVSMAQRITRPTVTSFLDLALESNRKDIQMEEIPVSGTTDLIDVMLKDSGIRQRFNLIIIAIKKADGSMLFNPSFETRILQGDTVIAVGEAENLQQLEKILNP